jgi:alkylation response protein AidB-like acyl-CoA dehydrogenase
MMRMVELSFTPQQLPPNARKLRTQVREFLEAELGERALRQRVQSWSAFDPQFSRKLGQRGWIGMTWPAKYGGGERNALDRYIVLEELLAAGAPVGAHWIADRQSGPLLLRYGTEEQRNTLLPAMARGESYFCIGMSEPSAGSDLAAVRTRASRVDGGWRINGSKIWTTNADRAHYMIALVRTGGDASSRHQGLSQLLVDLASPGVSIRPITDLTGAKHFNEVFLQDVFVPEAMLVGTEGEGWLQVTAELALERSGPERYLSSFCLLDTFARAVRESDDESIKAAIGRLTAQLWTVRQMSMSIAGQLAGGRDPSLEAAIVKDLGTELEQEVPALIQGLAEPKFLAEGTAGSGEALGYLLQIAPAFSLRGGTREILRGVIAKGLGLR